MKKRKNSAGLKAAIILAIIFLVAFIGAFVAFGFVATYVDDADIDNGFMAIFAYLLKAFPDIFTFSFHNPENYVYIALSGGLYFVLGLAFIYLIVGIIISAKRKRGIIVLGILASIIAIPVYFIMAAGLPKYFQIINSQKSDSIAKLVIPTFALLGTGVVYIVLSYVLYFVTIAHAYKKPAKAIEEKAENEIVEAPAEEQPAEEQPVEQPSDQAVVFEAIETEVTPENFEPVPEPEPVPESEAEPAPKEPEEEKDYEEPIQSEPEPKAKADDKEDLKSLLREIVRDIVRDEIARNNANQCRNEPNPLGPVTGATFGGPLVVQYFNGGINSTTPNQEQPAQQPIVQTVTEQPAPAPVKEEPKPEPAPVQEPAPEPEAEPVPVEEAAPAPEEVVPVKPMPKPPVPKPAEEKKPIIRIPFTERMLNADKEMQENYNELKNEILSYGVNSRVSNSGDTFRLHRKTYIKITIAGLSLKLYFALNPDDYKDSSLPVQNAGHKGIYAEIPLVFKVKSGLSMRRCKQLIQDVFDKNGLEQKEIGNIDWVKDLKNTASNNDGED